MMPTIGEFIGYLHSGNLPLIEDGLECISARIADDSVVDILSGQLKPMLRGAFKAFSYLYAEWNKTLEDQNEGGDYDDGPKLMALLKLCSRTISRVFRSPFYGPRIDVDSLVEYLQTIGPVVGKKEHAMEILESQSLLVGAVSSNTLFLALLAEIGAAVKAKSKFNCKSSKCTTSSNFKYLLDQLEKLIRRFEFQLSLYIESQINPADRNWSNFADLQVEAILSAVDELLGYCEKANKEHESMQIQILIEELENLLHLTIVYVEASGTKKKMKKIFEFFDDTINTTESPAYRFIVENFDQTVAELKKAKDAWNKAANKENEDDSNKAMATKDVEEFVDDFVKVIPEGGGDGELEKDWHLVDELETEPQDLSELEFEAAV